MYPFFESICIQNGKPLHIDYHQQRMEKCFQIVYGKACPFKLIDLIKVPKSIPQCTIKLRFLYDDRSFHWEYEQYEPKNIKTLQLVENNKINYSIKKTDRKDLDQLFRKRGSCDDILIVKNGFITDTSSANIVFFKGENMFTPNTPLLEGTCRARLLDEGKIKELTIRVEQLPFFDAFCLINALNDGTKSRLPISNIRMRHDP